MTAPEMVAARGDTALAERIVSELGVRTSPGSAVDAGWLAYLRHLTTTLVRAVVGRLVGLVEAIPLPPGWAKALLWVVGLTALALVVVVVVRVLQSRRRSPRPAATAPEMTAGEEEAAARERDAAGWRAELDALLAAGRAREALRALWWWLARVLAGAGADPSWTGRELLERCGRPDLLPLVRRLEALTYGRAHPAPSDLRALAAEVEGAVA